MEEPIRTLRSPNSRLSSALIGVRLERIIEWNPVVFSNESTFHFFGIHESCAWIISSYTRTVTITSVSFSGNAVNVLFITLVSHWTFWRLPVWMYESSNSLFNFLHLFGKGRAHFKNKQLSLENQVFEFHGFYSMKYYTVISN